MRGDFDLDALADMQAGRVIVKGVRTIYVIGAVVPLQRALAVEYQQRKLLLGFLKGVGVTVLHHKQRNVHHCALADTVIKADILVVASFDFLIHVHDCIPPF